MTLHADKHQSAMTRQATPVSEGRFLDGSNINHADHT
jgi:hypothetical protein